MQPLIITLDGPAGSGKSTLARLLAKQLGLEFLDTGAMYRGLTAFCLDSGVDPASDPSAAGRLARECQVWFNWATDPPALHIGRGTVEHDMTPRLRDADVTGKVSDLAAIAEVRAVMVASQQRIGRQHPRLVTEGRDQGSVVFPQAQVKFYLEASPEVRAKRRAQQLREANRPADEAQILQQIMHRDAKDSSRAEGPLICPEDAVRLDTSCMTLEQVLEELIRVVQNRLPAAAAS